MLTEDHPKPTPAFDSLLAMSKRVGWPAPLVLSQEISLELKMETYDDVLFSQKT